jgi:serine/threonine-protein kinase
VEAEIRERAPVDLEVGEVLAGKYRIERLLGRGGMGTVWLCTHLGLSERIAVKVMSRMMADNAEVHARFDREVRASAKIKSRYVARVYDTGDLPDGRPYFVMEYMEGQTLGQALQIVKTMSLADTARILGQVGRGLERAHELGIVHRDVKPDNVFLAHTADDGVVAKVFDFGVVKVFDAVSAADDTTQEGALLGTPQYMSPEQVEGTEVDLRSDIYAVGVMAFRMLTGKRLFPGESLSATLMKICNGPLPTITSFLPDIPPAVEEWFQRTCARNRDERFASAIECVDALAAAAGVMSVRDIPTLPPASTTQPDGIPALLVEPLEPGTSMSVGHPTRPPAEPTPPSTEREPARHASRTGALVAAAAAAVLLFGSVAMLAVRPNPPAPPVTSVASPPVVAPAVPPPQVEPAIASAAPPPATAEVPSTVPVESLPTAAAPPDAATRSASKPTPARRRDTPRAPAPPKTDPAPRDDERIHDVGY